MSDPAGGHPWELLSAYLDDELDAEERAGVDRHLADCAICRDHLESLRLLASAVGAEPVPDLPGGLAEAVGARVDAATLVPIRRRRWTVPASIAATIGAVGLLVALAWRDGRLTGTGAGGSRDDVVRDEGHARRELAQAPAAAKPREEGEATHAPAVPPAPAAEASKADNRPAASSAPPPSPRTSGPSALGYVAGGSAQVERKDASTAALQRDASSTAVAPPDSSESAPPKAAAMGIQDDAVPVGARARSAERGAGACAESWVDAGVAGVWSVKEIPAAVRDLAALGAALGGVGIETRDSQGPVCEVVVPAPKLADLVAALKGKGVTGLDRPVAAPGDAACVKLRVRLATEP